MAKLPFTEAVTYHTRGVSILLQCKIKRIDFAILMGMIRYDLKGNVDTFCSIIYKVQ